MNQPVRDQFRTLPRKLDPETEVSDELCEHYYAEDFNHDDSHTGHSPFCRKKETSKWAINPEWIKVAGEIIRSSPQGLFWVVTFLVELHEWCRLNNLALPENCDPSKWDMIPADRREVIVREFAARNIGAPFDPFDL